MSDTHSAYSESVSWVAWPIGEASRAQPKNVCGFCVGNDWHELGRRLAVAPVKDTTAFWLLLNKLLGKIGRLNWATFRNLLATSRGIHLATIQRLLVHYHLSWPGRTPAGVRPRMSRAWPPGPRKPLRGPAGHAFCGPRKIQPSRRQFSRVTLFFQPIHWPNRELQIRWNGILKLHTNLEIFASNPILKAHFFELWENVIEKSYASICSTKRHKFWPVRFRGKSLKSCQRDPYPDGCRHLAENFLGKPQIFCVSNMGTVEP